MYRDDYERDETTEVRMMRRRGLLHIKVGNNSGGGMSYPAYWSTDEYAIQKTQSARYVLIYTPKFRVEWHCWNEEDHKVLLELLKERDDETLKEWCNSFVRKAAQEACNDQESFLALIDYIFKQGMDKGTLETQKQSRKLLGLR